MVKPKLPTIHIPKTKSVYRMKRPDKGLEGWFVQVRYKNKAHRKFFSDTKFGGIQRAYDAAVLWRDHTEAKVGKPRSSRNIHAKATRQGRTGVKYREKKYKKKGGRETIRRVYEVTWSPETGKVGRTEVSIARWGEEVAYKKAIAIREDKEERYYTTPTKRKIGKRRVRRAEQIT